MIEILDSRVFQEFISSLPLFEILSGGTEKVRERYQLLGDPHLKYKDYYERAKDRQISESDSIVPYLTSGESRKAALLSVYYFYRDLEKSAGQHVADDLCLALQQHTSSEDDESRYLTGLSDAYTDPTYAAEKRPLNVYIPYWIVKLQAGYNARLVDIGFNLEKENSPHLYMLRLTPPEACAYLSDADDATGDVAILSPEGISQFLLGAWDKNKAGRTEKHDTIAKSRIDLQTRFDYLEEEEQVR